MLARKIIHVPHRKLRQRAQPVTNFGSRLQRLAEDMLETMHKAPGVGLAGPQIGVMQRIFVAEIPPDEDDPLSGRPFVMINPKIVSKSDYCIEGEEGCLSIPGYYGLVERPEEIVIEAQNHLGEPFRLTAAGFLARVFQHETDHLDGILFTDYIDDLEKIWLLDEEGERIPIDEMPPTRV